MNANKTAFVVSAGLAGTAIAGPPAGLIAAGIAWAVTDTDRFAALEATVEEKLGTTKD